jgi:hypothetical protein
MLAALGARRNMLEAELEGLAFKRAMIKDGATGEGGEIPEHVREIMDFLAARVRAELDWSATFRERVRDGAYWFEGDPEP